MTFSTARTRLRREQKGYAFVTFEERRLGASLSVNSPQGTALRFVHNHFGCRLIHFELVVRFLDLRGVLFQLGCERLYLLLLLRDGCLQALNCLIEHGLLGGVGNGLGPDAAFWRKSTQVGSIRGDRAQSSIGIDYDHSRRGG